MYGFLNVKKKKRHIFTEPAVPFSDVFCTCTKYIYHALSCSYVLAILTIYMFETFTMFSIFAGHEWKNGESHAESFTSKKWLNKV